MKDRIIYALGYFDGVHLGHQALLSACREIARENRCQSGAVTFLGHPQQLLTGESPKLINTPEDRRALLLQQVDTVLELPFDQKLMDTTWEQFLDQLVEKQNGAGFVCGSDFRFGQKGMGTAVLLQQYCEDRKLPCRIVPQQTIDGIRISSTHIRALLEQGNIPEAERFLGHPHILSGTVVAGKQLGRTIGIPTANVDYPGFLVQLPYGVYACRVTAEGKAYRSVTNVGIRPTVNGQGVNAENWLQEFSGDLYGKTVQIAFCRFLRPEQKFSQLSDLKEQIEKDKKSLHELCIPAENS